MEITADMIIRAMEAVILEDAKGYPIVTITGPRQSGKTTLIKKLFPNFPYFSLEDPDVRLAIQKDPRQIFTEYGHRIIFDEVQRYPEILSYIQGIVDADKSAQFILSGSQNMLMMESVSQTLAGRTAIFYLLPLSYEELLRHENDEAKVDRFELMYKGGYPRIYDSGLDARRFYNRYVETYVQRDARQVKNIGNLDLFTRFIAICAAHIGQTINSSKLANAVGANEKTIKSWLSILETSYIIYRLPPYFKNFKKRIVKSPKLYFHDIGLAASLLNINSSDELKNHSLLGALHENFVINEIGKSYYNEGITPPFYFWRDSNQHEIDLLINRGVNLQPIEIKSSLTYRKDYFKHLDWFSKTADHPLGTPLVIYGAEQDWEYENGKLLSWRKVHLIKSAYR